MLLALYTLTMSMATLLMAANCWVAAIPLIGIGVGLSVWCWRKNRERWNGVERRTGDRRHHPARRVADSSI